MPRTLFDWPSIATDYIQGEIDPETGRRKWPTFKDLAEKYEVKPNTIGRRAAREGWTQQRQEFIQAAMEQAYQEGLDARAEEIVKMDKTHSDLAQNLMVFVDQWVRKHAKRTPDGRIVDLELPKPDELSKITSSMQRLQAVQRTAMGLPATNPPSVTRHQVTLDGSLKVASDPVAQVFMLIQEMDEDALTAFIDKLESRLGTRHAPQLRSPSSGGAGE